MVMRQYIIMYVDAHGTERALHFEEASPNHLSIEYVINNEVLLRNNHTAVKPFFGVGYLYLKNIARVLPSGVNVVHGVVPCSLSDTVRPTVLHIGTANGDDGVVIANTTTNTFVWIPWQPCAWSPGQRICCQNTYWLVSVQQEWNVIEIRSLGAPLTTMWYAKPPTIGSVIVGLELQEQVLIVHLDICSNNNVVRHTKSEYNITSKSWSVGTYVEATENRIETEFHYTLFKKPELTLIHETRLDKPLAIKFTKKRTRYRSPHYRPTRSASSPKTIVSGECEWLVHTVVTEKRRDSSYRCAKFGITVRSIVALNRFEQFVKTAKEMIDAEFCTKEKFIERMVDLIQNKKEATAWSGKWYDVWYDVQDVWLEV